MDVSVLVGRRWWECGGQSRRRVFTLPWFFVRQVDALLERWRREEHEAALLAMNGGNVCATLVEAAREGGLRDVTFLISRGAGVNCTSQGWCAIEWSAGNGHMEVTAALIAAGATRLNSALCWAAYENHISVAALLLENGADVHAWRDEALQWAATMGHVEMARFLLEAGADLEVARGQALRWARIYKHSSVIALLEAATADV